MSIDLELLQELPEQQQPQLEFCCPIPYISTFATCLACTFTR